MKPGDQVAPERRQPNPKGSLRRMVGALSRCWHVWLAVVVFALIGMWLAWIYVRHGEDPFHEILGRMIAGEWEERPNDPSSATAERCAVAAKVERSDGIWPVEASGAGSRFPLAGVLANSIYRLSERLHQWSSQRRICIRRKSPAEFASALRRQSVFRLEQSWAAKPWWEAASNTQQGIGGAQATAPSDNNNLGKNSQP